MLRNPRRPLWAAVAAAGCLAAWSVADGKGFRRYLRLEQDVAALRERNRALAEANREKRREVEALRSDPRALERAAREELGFVKPGEVVINLEGR